jgi:hypothetical protein
MSKKSNRARRLATLVGLSLSSFCLIAMHSNRAYASVPYSIQANTGYAAASTSPSLAEKSNGVVFSYVLAYQGPNGDLFLSGNVPGATGDTGLGMAAGTSPSVAFLPNGSFVATFQANTGNLWLTYYGGSRDLGLGMLHGTSPSIVGYGNNEYAIAFQANTGILWTTGSPGTANWGLGMAPHTSPAITAANGSFAVVFQANTGHLWSAGVYGTGDLGWTLQPSTSPAICTPEAGGGIEVAFHHSSGLLGVMGALGTGLSSFQMQNGTSPAIVCAGESVSGAGAFEVAFDEASSGYVWQAGSYGNAPTSLIPLPGTSPTIATTLLL